MLAVERPGSQTRSYACIATIELLLLVRTDFTSDDAWQQVSDEAQREHEDGFHAYLEPVRDHARWDQVRAAVPAGD